jgi:hypothetical protein
LQAIGQSRAGKENLRCSTSIDECVAPVVMVFSDEATPFRVVIDLQIGLIILRYLG